MNHNISTMSGFRNFYEWEQEGNKVKLVIYEKLKYLKTLANLGDFIIYENSKKYIRLPKNCFTSLAFNDIVAERFGDKDTNWSSLQDYESWKEMQLERENAFNQEKLRREFVNTLHSKYDKDYDENIHKENLEDYTTKYWELDKLPVEGDFIDKIFNSRVKTMLSNAYKAVIKINLRDKILNKPYGWSNNETYVKILTKELINDNHSGCSFRGVMDDIEDIIKYGWVKYLALQKKSSLSRI